ncbi:MAG: right-handed parallel beta-helix repeat-containing protein [Anaerolineae bacterium]
MAQAIIDANSNAGVEDIITFNIPGTGPFTITTSLGFTISDSVIIDGTTQPGYTNHPMIEIRPSQAGVTYGMRVYGTATYDPNLTATIQGLAFTGFTSGSAILLADGQGHVIQDNNIGVDAAGTTEGPNSTGITVSAPNVTIAYNDIESNLGTGIFVYTTGDRVSTNDTILSNYIGYNDRGIVLGSGASNVTVDRNTIGGSTNEGLQITDSPVGNHIIVGNFIGVNSSGTAVSRNGTGISIQQSGSNTIGGTTAGARNIISGNYDNGIVIGGANSTGNIIQGNYIGTNAAGTGNLGNLSNGIYLSGGAANNTIGSSTVTAGGNLIAFNGGRGIYLDTSAGTGNRIARNSIFSNTALGIDLGSIGVNGNDNGDPDTGANNLQNAPLLVIQSQATSTLTGTFNSAANQTFTIEVFQTTCDASGFGEGQTYVTSFDVTTNGSGNATINQALGTLIAEGLGVAATATDASGNTSEFSGCVVPSADLSVTHTDSTDPILSGMGLTYTITVTNNSSANYARSVVVTETLSNGVTFGSANSTQGSCSHVTGVVTCTVGTMTTSAVVTITVDVTVNPATTGTVTSTASVISTTADPNTLNNTLGQNTVSTQFLPIGTTVVSYGNPTYQWPDIAGAQYYYLLINNASGTQVINEVLSDAGYCNGSTCSIDATTLRETYRLTNGSYTAYMNTWNGTALGTWRGPFSFTLSAPPPGLPTLDAPSNITSLRPTFTWSLSGSALNATYFNLYVAAPGNAAAPTINQWVTRASACGSPTGTTCSLLAPSDLLDGTAYSAYLRSYGPGGLSTYAGPQAFVVNAPPPVLPSGIVINPNQGRPTITWNDDTAASYFYVSILNNSSTAVYSQWLTRASVCTPTCAVTPVIHLPSGSYSVVMAAWGPGGMSLGGNSGYTAPVPFALNFAAPNIADIITVSPSSVGSIQTGSPTFTWNTAAGSTYYYLWISGAAPGFTPSFFQQWYDAASICTPHPGTCTVSNVVNLGQGSYAFRLQAYGAGGGSALSGGFAFSVSSSLPTALNLQTPNSTITNPAPAFVWDDNTAVDWYNVVVSGSGGTVSDQWYRATRGVGQLCSAGQCSLTLSGVTLANGGYTWNARGYGAAGTGAFATPRSFTVSVPVPAAPTLVTPNDAAVINTTNRPTFVWNTSASAAWYNLEISSGVAVVFSQWYQAGVGGCTVTTCTLQIPNPLAYGGYTWRVRAWSQGGLGTFSASRPFFSLSLNPQPLMIGADESRCSAAACGT